MAEAAKANESNMLNEVLGTASTIAPLVGGGGQPSALLSRADASVYSPINLSGEFNTGDFNLGGTKTTNTLFWVVGIVALIYLLRGYFKK